MSDKNQQPTNDEKLLAFTDPEKSEWEGYSNPPPVCHTGWTTQDWVNYTSVWKKKSCRHDIRVTYADGNTVTTGFNGTKEEARAYYVGKFFEFDENKPAVEAIKVEFLD